MQCIKSICSLKSQLFLDSIPSIRMSSRKLDILLKLLQRIWNSYVVKAPLVVVSSPSSKSTLPNCQDDMINTSLNQCFNLMQHHWLITKFNQWFGTVKSKWSQSGAKTADKNNGLHFLFKVLSKIIRKIFNVFVECVSWMIFSSIVFWSGSKKERKH